MTAPKDVYTLADLRDWPAATAGVQPPLRLAVIGDPVAHSASPPVHNAALAACGFNFRYTRLHLTAEELPEAVRLLPRAGFIGFNVTLPHKTAILPLLNKVDPSAATLGAVNTVRVEAGGALRGLNTDGPGFVAAVREEFNLELPKARVLILGAGGGAGRALAAQCALEGCGKLRLVNRTPEKAAALAGSLRAVWPRLMVEAVPWQTSALEQALADTDLLVNASSVGLRDADGSPVPASALAPQIRVFDTVYRRDGLPTPLLAAARTAGSPAIGGLALLLHQGALSFEHWFGQDAPRRVMRGALKNLRAPV